ncbi:hypothetical protein B0T22DRAFT_482443 [Podospora appendiculata]|uniref:Uncharacterized protein n=1 Tax=Podospora appendiculata TaxID=314037 RepID=A0AAE0X5T6_9PEZI|nr:hypothetical protein B0T22DRAFT_482443 [Podospora appendiculata]
MTVAAGQQPAGGAPSPPRLRERRSSVTGNTQVILALEMVRDSFEGATDATLCAILEEAITTVWAKIEAMPSSYVMTRDEFSVFNYFQARFKGNPIAVAARARYWDNTQG